MQAPGGGVRPQDVLRALSGWRCDLVFERTTQADIASALHAARIPFVRERRIGDGEIIDFLIEGAWGGIGIEVKIGGSKRAIYRQCKRYCDLGVLEAVVLATGVPIGLPERIGGTPVFVADLTRAWL